MTVPSRDRLRRAGEIAVFCAAALVGALVLPPGKSILPLSLLTGLLAFLASLFARAPRHAEGGTALPEMPGLEPFPAEAPPFFEAVEPAEPWPIWQWLQYAAIAAAALLFVYFMIKPLFNRERGGVPPAEKLRRLIIRWFSNFRLALIRLVAFFREREPQAGIGKDLREVSAGLLEVYARQKRRELRGSITLFAKLIIWGDAAIGVAWKPAYGPGEYCALLREALLKASFLKASFLQKEPENPPADTRSQAIIRCGELFERELYGPAPLSAGERREFKQLVKGVTGGLKNCPAGDW